MKRATLLRSGIPALIVALVLGLSFLVPASASDQKHTKPPACGYGYGDKDNDERPLRPRRVERESRHEVGEDTRERQDCDICFFRARHEVVLA